MDRLEVIHLGGDEEDRVSEGEYDAVTEKVERMQTRIGKRAFIVCRITSPEKDHNRTVDYMIYRRLADTSDFYRHFVKPVCGPIGDTVLLDQLVGLPCVITVKHIKKKNGRVYANVVAIRPKPRKG